MPSLIKGNFKMERFASYFLSDQLGMPVIDKTNLLGIYDITLKVDTLLLRGLVEGGQEGRRSGPDQKLDFEFNPPLPRALEEQLGLHLERSKVQVETLVIDHLEKATEN
jgi:uncharacterized protein (TIGR03435 family)